MEVKRQKEVDPKKRLLRRETLETAPTRRNPLLQSGSRRRRRLSALPPERRRGIAIEEKLGKMQSAEAAPVLSPTAAAAAKAAAAGLVTDLQKKLLRAERFGMPVQLSEEEKRSSRAERFGMGSTIHGKSEELKRKARAERFGVAAQPSGDEEEKKKARLARFGQAPASDTLEEEKRKARAARFSQTAPPAPSESNGKFSHSPGILWFQLRGCVLTDDNEDDFTAHRSRYNNNNAERGGKVLWGSKKSGRSQRPFLMYYHVGM
ncbi:unnamed protein product [Spirodela intermedia]|uniref:THO1-MOS11 C-terminal domain-containing protein n=1 Tax=Spirodela intermedia TaxID=51605 RepID=A0A7I8IB82_SPIIN|nr:unnamed protein product [Spirodela intermedia]CAA6654838.1 unnamed protein product [Spirodela intermedia]